MTLGGAAVVWLWEGWGRPQWQGAVRTCYGTARSWLGQSSMSASVGNVEPYEMEIQIH